MPTNQKKDDIEKYLNTEMHTSVLTEEQQLAHAESLA
jgi:hypothetical protein